MKDILRMVIVLGLICTVSGLALAGVYRATQGPIEQQLLQIKAASIEAVLSGYDNLPIDDRIRMLAGQDNKGRDVYKFIFPAKTGGELTSLALEEQGFGYDPAPIAVMVGLTLDGDLTGISIISHKETPGKGSLVTEPDFTGRFAGLTADGVSGVDTISGATISSVAVKDAVQRAMTFYLENKDEILAQIN